MDIKSLLISKVRIKLLNVYLNVENPTDGYHVRALVRMLEEEINAVRRELKNMEAFGLLKSTKQGNKLVFVLNEDFIFISELRGLVRKNRNDVKTIFKGIRHLNSIEVSYLTNKFFTGKYDNPNDLDLLFIGDTEVGVIKSTVTKIEEEIARSLRYGIITKSDYHFLIKKKEDFLINLLSEDKIILTGSETNLYL